jgi:hypothetical protein
VIDRTPSSDPYAKDTTTTPPYAQAFAQALGWNRTSYLMLSGFVLLLGLMGYVWWPLAEEYLGYINWQGAWWRQIDWLLIGIFLFMSLMLMNGADLRQDLPIILVGIGGGLVIESWGTQTEIWTYYTNERPPLWIIPAWPIAALTIDRMVRFLRRRVPAGRATGYRLAYWLVFPLFFILMLQFTWTTLDKSFTLLALLLCALFIVTPTDHRLALLTFAAGTGLGYFLEWWGTTRLCWTYYTGETPPLFAVLAHGMAAVAFWRAVLMSERVSSWLWLVLGSTQRQAPPAPEN